MDARARAESGDNAVKTLVSKAQAAAERLASKAQSAADAAQASADAAQATADAAYCPSYKPFAVGTCAVSQGKDAVIDVGFMPSFVTVIGDTPVSQGSIQNFLFSCRGSSSPTVQYRSTGFTVQGTGFAYNMFQSGRIFYIAFR